MITYIITLIMGIIMGFVIDRKFFRKEERELNTDECLAYLREKGYYINMNVLPDKDDRK